MSQRGRAWRRRKLVAYAVEQLSKPGWPDVTQYAVATGNGGHPVGIFSCLQKKDVANVLAVRTVNGEVLADEKLQQFLAVQEAVERLDGTRKTLANWYNQPIDWTKARIAPGQNIPRFFMHTQPHKAKQQLVVDDLSELERCVVAVGEFGFPEDEEPKE